MFSETFMIWFAISNCSLSLLLLSNFELKLLRTCCAAVVDLLDGGFDFFEKEGNILASVRPFKQYWELCISF
jgi:hypothetical protein